MWSGNELRNWRACRLYVNRLKTGVGEKVDIALVDSMVSSLEIINIIYLNTGRIPTRIGNRYEAIYPYDSFPGA